MTLVQLNKEESPRHREGLWLHLVRLPGALDSKVDSDENEKKVVEMRNSTKVE